MNFKLIETLLIALLPLFAATSAAYAGVTPPEHEIERKLRGSDNIKTEGFDVLTSLLLQDKPKKPTTMKGAEAEGAGAFAANHAHGERMLKGSSSDDRVPYYKGQGDKRAAAVIWIIPLAANWFYNYIVEVAGAPVLLCNEQTYIDTFGGAFFNALTFQCDLAGDLGTITPACVKASIRELLDVDTSLLILSGLGGLRPAP